MVGWEGNYLGQGIGLLGGVLTNFDFEPGGAEDPLGAGHFGRPHEHSKQKFLSNIHNRLQEREVVAANQVFQSISLGFFLEGGLFWVLNQKNVLNLLFQTKKGSLIIPQMILNQLI